MRRSKKVAVRQVMQVLQVMVNLRFHHLGNVNQHVGSPTPTNNGGGGTVPINGSQVVILSPEHPRLVELFALYSCASTPRMNQM